MVSSIFLSQIWAVFIKWLLCVRPTHYLSKFHNIVELTESDFQLSGKEIEAQRSFQIENIVQLHWLMSGEAEKQGF